VARRFVTVSCASLARSSRTGGSVAVGWLADTATVVYAAPNIVSHCSLVAGLNT